MGNLIKVLSAGILLGMLPVMISAKTSGIAGRTAINFSVVYNVTVVDSIAKGKLQDEKKTDSKKTSKADKEKDPKQDPKTVDIDKKRPEIKEVPKARPKLRPGAVTDRIKIKRPPVKVKPGRGLHLGL